MNRVIVLTGDGKGKTTSGLGMLMRAWGHGMPSAIVQFMKAGQSGELSTLSQLGIELIRGGHGFAPAPADPEFASHREAALAMLDRVIEFMDRRCAGFYLLDEACTASNRGLIPASVLVTLADLPAKDSIVVFTGRGAPPELVERADTVTVMNSVKHAFDVGGEPQLGVEF